jgi:alcohol dehydrogenase class IV
MRFEFATATRIYFGSGASAELGRIAAAYGQRVLLVTGSARRAGDAVTGLKAAGLDVSVHVTSGEPTIAKAEEAVAAARAHDTQLVLGFGGGSALDMAKAVGALTANDGDVLDYLEVIGRGKPLTSPSLPVIAVPTTSGTGSEVTANAVLASPEQRVKVSLRSPHMLPRAAVIDPLLTLDLPPDVTAYTGMDALTQCIEPYVSNKANPMTDLLAREGISRAAGSLLQAYASGRDEEARWNMSYAALLGGMSLANAKLGAVHGFAAVIGGMYDAPHGAICAALLPHVMRANLAALAAREPASPVLARFAEAAQLMTGEAGASAEQGAEWVADLVQSLFIAPLGAYGVTAGDIDDIARKSASASSMQGNPIRLTHDELCAILEAAL